MGTRWVLHAEAAEQVDTEPLMRRLGEDVARDASAIVVKRSGRTSQSIEVTEVDDRHAVVTASPKNPNSNPGHMEYGYWLEKGTSDTPAEPYLRPATYRYRSP